MLTNPSTLGLFEDQVVEILDAVHAAGALAYMDGANLNAVMGTFRPGTPPGSTSCTSTRTRPSPRRTAGAGPAPARSRWGSGFCRSCPRPGSCASRTARSGSSGRASGRPASAGCARTWAAWACWCAPTRTCGRTAARGLAEVSEDAVLAANYLRHRLRGTYDIPYDRVCKHEFVASSATLHRETGIRTLDVAKRLIDHGHHPPTIYFPLIVEEAMLIEPTETEALETLDAFADALVAIAGEAHSDPDAGAHGAPHGAGAAARRGHGRAPARPALAPDDGRGDALPGLTGGGASGADGIAGRDGRRAGSAHQRAGPATWPRSGRPPSRVELATRRGWRPRLTCAGRPALLCGPWRGRYPPGRCRRP